MCSHAINNRIISLPICTTNINAIDLTFATAVPRIKTFGEVEETTIEVIWEPFEGAKSYKVIVKVILYQENVSIQDALRALICISMHAKHSYFFYLLSALSHLQHQVINCITMQQDFAHEEWTKDNVSEFKFEGSVTKGVVEDLYPTSTFQFKLIAIMEDGTESAESEIMDCDTKVANCGPKKSTCVIS